jgi:purine-binding chemotaxis protein CheW
LPCVPDFITGLVNIKGEFITILDIRKFYDDITTTIKEKSTIIIINSDEFKIGILADEILESMNINFNEIIQNKLQKQDEDKLNEFVKNEEIYQVLDIEKLLQDKRLTVC